MSWGKVLTQAERGLIRSFLTTNRNYDYLLVKLQITDDLEQLGSSYWKLHSSKHISQPSQSNFANWFGNDDNINPRKRRNDSKSSGIANKKRKVSIKCKQIYKFKFSDDNFKSIIPKRCFCVYNIETRCDKNGFGEWLTKEDAVNELNNLSLWKLSRYTAAKIKAIAAYHNFNGKHGNSRKNRVDFLVMHLVKCIDVNDYDSS